MLNHRSPAVPSRALCISLFAFGIVAFPAVQARAQIVYQMRVIGNQPAVLWGGSAGPGVNSFSPERFNVTDDGYVYHLNNSASGHYGTWVHSPALASPNNAPTMSRVGQVTHYASATGALRNLYRGSVPGGDNTDPTNAYYGRPGLNGITRQTPSNTYFAWNGGGQPVFYEIKFENGSGAYDPTAGTAAMVGRFGGIGIDGSNHKQDLELYGAGAASDTWRLLGGVRPNPEVARVSYIRKVELGELTGHGPTAYGARTIASGGRLVDAFGTPTSHTDVINDLVPLLSDTVKGYAMNPADGNLYFVSQDTTTNPADPRVYLSALELDDWGTLASNIVATPVDLDPNSAATYLDLTYDSGDSAPDLTSAGDLAFSADGSTLFVSNGIYGPDARFFIFDILDITPTTPAVVPEPASLLLLAVGLVGVALMRRRRMA